MTQYSSGSLEAAEEHSPTPDDFVAFIPWMCLQLEHPLEVVVFKEDVYMSDLKVNKTTATSGRELVSAKSRFKISTAVQRVTSLATFERYPNAIKIVAIYNILEQLVEIKIHKKSPKVPPSLIQVLTTTLYFHPECLKITLSVGITSAIIIELANLLSESNITDVCLDDTYMSNDKWNYDELLLRLSSLKHLSLARCVIGDAGVKRIAPYLEFGTPASRTLCLLNLTSNRITDVGAECIAKALRTNRKLFYLNLAGNCIADEGMDSITRSLLEFPLTFEEMFTHKKKGLVALRQKLMKEDECRKQSRQSTPSGPTPRLHTKSTKYKKTRTRTDSRTEICISDDNREEETVTTPFDKKDTVIRDGCLYSKGNNVLCCLNVAYNRWSYNALHGILDVLVYQKVHRRHPMGLWAVNIEGNNLPVTCYELHLINELLEDNIPKHEPPAMKKKANLSSKSRITMPSKSQMGHSL